MQMITSPIATLTTSRLILRQWQDTDYPRFAALVADPIVMRYFPKCLNTAESQQFIDWCRDLIAAQGWGFWAVELKQNSEFIGFVGLHAQPTQFSFSPCVEIGWRIAKAYWQQGYATEAAQACLKFAFEQLDLSHVVAFTAKENMPSEKVMQRLGMQYIQNFDHPKLTAESPLLEHKLYRIERDQFQG